MEKFLPVYMVIFALMLATLFFMVLHSNGSFLQRWDGIRIRSNEQSHKGITEPQEEKPEPGQTLVWLVLGAILLLICMVLSKV